MPNPTITSKKPAYRVSVRDAFICFIDSHTAGGAVTYENEIVRLPVLKSVGVRPDAQEKKIYASGIVYAQTTRVSGTDLEVDAVALPTDLVRKARGAVRVGTSGLSYDQAHPTRPEFAFGFIDDMSDGSEEYRFYPRCVLNIPEEDHETSEDEDPDPEDSYTISSMPTEENVTRVYYATGDAATGKTPLTPEAFFGALPYTVAQIEALGATEAPGT